MRPYGHSDKELINSWLKLHNQELKDYEWSDIGFIVEGIAAGFLIKAERNYGFLESYITAPGNTKEQRQEALNMITDALIEEAKRLGIKKLFAITANKGIIERCKTYGFSHVGNYEIFEKEL